MKLHVQSPDLPGGIKVPRAIEVINEKLDLIERLNDLKLKYTSTESKLRQEYDYMILIEMEAIKDLINIDKKSQ